MEMSRLTRDGTVEPVSRDQILGHERGQGNIISIFPVQLTKCRTGNLTRLIHTVAICMCDHTYIHTTYNSLIFLGSACTEVTFVLVYSILYVFRDSN